jgi:hypothetical protein
MKKLKLEDTCLTIEQVRELQSLGIDFSNAVMEFTHYDNDGADEWFLTIVDDYADSEFADIENMPTLTNTEMLEMIPMDIEAKSKKYGNQTVYLSIDRHSVMYCVSGIEFERGLYVYISFEKPLLRDALFEMIKWLKTNKLI